LKIERWKLKILSLPLLSLGFMNFMNFLINPLLPFDLCPLTYFYLITYYLLVILPFAL